MTILDPEEVDGIPVLCEQCGTVTTKESEEKAEKVAESHNQSRHNNDSVAVAVTDEYDVKTSQADNRDTFIKQIWKLVK